MLQMRKDKTGMQKLSQFGAKKFSVTTHDEYKPCYEMIKNAKVKLSE